jgi:hypothetical protein
MVAYEMAQQLVARRGSNSLGNAGCEWLGLYQMLCPDELFELVLGFGVSESLLASLFRVIITWTGALSSRKDQDN